MQRIILVLGAFLLTACQALDTPAVTVLDGTAADLSQIRNGRPTIMNFWAANCSFCKDELPHFERVAQEYPEIAVIGINLQEPRKIASTYWQSGGYTFETWLDPESFLKTSYDVFTQPTTIFFDARGSEVFRKNGPMEEKEINDRVRELLSSKTESDSLSVISDLVVPPITDHQSPITKSPVPRLLSSWYQDAVQHSIPLQEIFSGGPPKDGIPSIDNPKFLLSRQVDFLEDDDIGILVEQGNHVKFYPYKILNWHEIVNDEIDGEYIVVTYCPLCATGVVYSSLISEGNTEFGVSGFLYQSNLLMYDRATDSLWNQVTGEAVVGPLTSEKLHRINSDIVRYSAAKAVSPDVLVLSTETGFIRDYNHTPYQGYEESDRTMFPTNAVGDTRLHPKTLVYGVTVGGHALAITEEFIRENVVFQGYVGEGENRIPLQITFDPKTEQIDIIRYDKDEPGRKDQLLPVPAYWFSWLAMYPETELMQ